MNLKRWITAAVIIVCGIALVWILTEGARIADQDDGGEDDPVHWQELLQTLNKTLVAAQKVAARVEKNLGHRSTEVNDRLTSMEQHVSAYRFMLNSYDPDDTFEIMLRCRQISDVRTDFIEIRDEVKMWQGELTKIISRIERMKNDLKAEAGRQPENLRRTILHDVAESESFLAELAKLEKPVFGLQPRIDEVGAQIEALYERAQNERQNVIDNVFFERGDTYIYAVRTMYSYMPRWRLKIAGWLSIQIPSGMNFWAAFLMLLVSFMIPVTYFVKSVLEPFAYKYHLLAETPQCRHLFRTAFFMSAIAVVLYIATGWLSESENGIFLQAAKSLGAVAMLLFALVLREKECELFPAIRLYLPVILQHIGGMLLYMMLAPSSPLVLFLPPLNMIVFIWLLWQVSNTKHHWFDVTCAVLSLIVSVISGGMAAIGFPYLAFTLTLGWLVIVAQFQLVTAITKSVTQFVRNNRQRALLNAVMTRFFIPLCWIWAFLTLVNWATATYHLEDYLEQAMHYRFPLPDIIHVDANRLILAFTVAFIVQFIIKFVKEWINLKFGDAAESGLAASSMTLGIYLVWSVFALFAMFLCNVDTNGVMVMMGGLCVGLGFALKSVAENFISGIALLIGQQIRPGDIIEVNSSTGQVGRVRKVSFSVTTVETEDGAMITFPNAQVTSKEFRNWTRNNPYRRFDIEIDIPYGTDLVKVRKLLADTASSAKGVEHSPAPIVFLSSFEDSSIKFVIRLWMVAAHFREVSTNLRIKVVEALAQNNIEMPFPQLDVHIIENDAVKSQKAVVEKSIG